MCAAAQLPVPTYKTKDASLGSGATHSGQGFLPQLTPADETATGMLRGPSPR